MKMTRSRKTIAASLATFLLAATSASAQTDASRIDDLEAKATEMARELATLRVELEKAKDASAAEEIQALRTDVAAASQAARRASQSANEWKNTTSVSHLAGYGSAGYVNPENGNDSFAGNFNPIFHFQYGDRVLWESELEFEIEENGETEVALEYSTIDFFLNDNLIFLAGKFISPLGNFRQNIHPAWINKLPSAPPGFGHDGAAPLAEIGFQLRGGARLGERSKVTYAAYVGMGPKLEGEDGEVHGIDTDGFTEDPDGEKVLGGRLSFLPIPKLEIGLSGAFGDVAVVENDGIEVDGDPLRDYSVLGIDASYQWRNFDFRAEYIQQDVADSAQSVAAEGGTWETWYTQGAYKFGQAKWEGVLRYTDYSSPHANKSQKQWAMGLNYLLTPNAMVKLGYEFNDGLIGEATDDDRWLLQIAYGY